MYQGAAMATRTRRARQSKTARAQVRMSLHNAQKMNVTAIGTRIAIGPFASTPSPIAAWVA